MPDCERQGPALIDAAPRLARDGEAAALIQPVPGIVRSPRVAAFHTRYDRAIAVRVSNPDATRELMRGISGRRS